jgi:hypothetical protein
MRYKGNKKEKGTSYISFLKGEPVRAVNKKTAGTSWYDFGFMKG